MNNSTLVSYKRKLKELRNYNDVQSIAKHQLGYLGEPLVVSDSIIDAVHVAHMSSGNASHRTGAPQLPNGAPMADFVYEDLIMRSEEIVQRYLCGEDIFLAHDSQMTRLLVRHLQKYHGLLRSVAKEAKRALVGHRSRHREVFHTAKLGAVGASDTANLVKRNQEIENKKTQIAGLQNDGDQNKRARAMAVLGRLERKQAEVRAQLAKAGANANALLRRSADSSAASSTAFTSASAPRGMRSTACGQLHESTKAAVAGVILLKRPKVIVTDNGCCTAMSKVSPRADAQLVFASHPLSDPREQAGGGTISATNARRKVYSIFCEDVRVSSMDVRVFSEWRGDRDTTAKVVSEGIADVSKTSAVPFRTLYGDRLMKRWLVAHSFMDRLHVALYSSFSMGKNTANSLMHPLQKRFPAIFDTDANGTLSPNASNGTIAPNAKNDKTLESALDLVRKKFGLNDVYKRIPTNLHANYWAELPTDTSKLKRLEGLLPPGKTLKDLEGLVSSASSRKLPRPGGKEYVTLSEMIKTSRSVQHLTLAASITQEHTNALIRVTLSSSMYSLARAMTRTNKTRASRSKMSNTDTSVLMWREDLRSFGDQGPQDYWVQLVREMYDARRVEHVRHVMLRKHGKQKAALDSKEVRARFLSLGLGNNLGVTEYGYTISNPMDASSAWNKSYHRFGRAWYCSDVNGDPFQLPFGCYKDKCAPPVGTRQQANNDNGNNDNAAHHQQGQHTMGVQGDLATVVMNNIVTTILQPSTRYGTQGRYGHVRTAYKTKVPVGRLSPAEAYGRFLELRQAEFPLAGVNNANKTLMTQPLQISSDTASSVTVLLGPRLDESIMHARKGIRLVPPAPVVFTPGVPLWNHFRDQGWSAVGIDDMLTNSKMYKNLVNVRNMIKSPNHNSRQNGRNASVSKFNTNDIVKSIDNDLHNNNAVKGRTAERKRRLVAMLEGSENSNWNSSTTGKKMVTGYNIDRARWRQFGSGLTRSVDLAPKDASVLDENFVMVDGDILTGCEASLQCLLYGGNGTALGVSKKTNTYNNIEYPMIPLIVPLNPHHGAYKQVKANCEVHFEALHADAQSNVGGLVARTMENVCKPLLKSGMLLKGTHYNDLMRRFFALTEGVQKGAELYDKMRNPGLHNIMKCLQFYLYLHLGLSTRQALDQIAEYQANRNARNQQNDMFEMSRKLRLLGDLGPMPEAVFKKVVKQYLLTSRDKGLREKNQVNTEVAEVEQQLASFRLFGSGKRFARMSFLPSFMGGKQKANKRMGAPSGGNKYISPKGLLQRHSVRTTGRADKQTNRALAGSAQNLAAIRQRRVSRATLTSQNRTLSAVEQRGARTMNVASRVGRKAKAVAGLAKAVPRGAMRASNAFVDGMTRGGAGP